jgi:hypothetical protein
MAHMCRNMPLDGHCLDLFFLYEYLQFFLTITKKVIESKLHLLEIVLC